MMQVCHGLLSLYFVNVVFSELQAELARTQTGISLLEDCRVTCANKTSLNSSVVFLNPCATVT